MTWDFCYGHGGNEAESVGSICDQGEGWLYAALRSLTLLSVRGGLATEWKPEEGKREVVTGTRRG